MSEIGFGAWGIGGSTPKAIAYGLTDEGESRRALQRAFDLGVTFYDTAPLYGEGRSERLIGEAFHGVRSQVVIASKVGVLDDAGTQDFSPAQLRASLVASLRRLQTEYLDVYFLHSPPRPILERDEVWTTLAALRQEGSIRAFGVSVAEPADALVAVARGAAAVQVNFNLVDQRILALNLPARCEAAGTGIIVRTPLCFGFLTGAYAPETAFDAQDHRSRWAPAQRARWASAFHQFAELWQRDGQTPAQFALRFCLSYPAVATTIPGMLTAVHVEENVAASRLGPLTKADREAAERIYARHRFFLNREAQSPAAAGGA